MGQLIDSVLEPKFIENLDKMVKGLELCKEAAEYFATQGMNLSEDMLFDEMLKEMRAIVDEAKN